MAYNTDISEIQDGESGNATVASRPHQKLLENTNYLKGLTDIQVSRADLQASTYTAFTTAGSSTAYTLTPTPSISSYSTGQLFIVTPHTTAGATPTMAISGLAVKNLKQYDSTGAKVAVSSTTFIASVRYFILYDGTDLVILNPLPASAVSGGAIVQIPAATIDTTNRSTASATYTASGVTISITPTSASNNVRFRCYGYAGASAGLVMYLTIYRNATTDLTPAGVLGFTQALPSSNAVGEQLSFEGTDAPATTSATTYDLFWRVSASTGYLGRRGVDTNIDVPTILIAEEYTP